MRSVTKTFVHNSMLQLFLAREGRHARENRLRLPDEAPLCYLKSLGPLNLGVVHAVKLFSGLADTMPDADKTGQFLFASMK